MNPIIFKQTNNEEIYEININHDCDNNEYSNSKTIVIDGNSVYYINNIIHLQYKVNIIKKIELLQKNKEDYNYEQKINDEYNNMFNYLLNFNIFEIADHYKDYLLNNEENLKNNKFLSFYGKIIEFYRRKNEIYNEYTPSKSKSKIHYDINIEILKSNLMKKNFYYDEYLIRNKILDNIGYIFDGNGIFNGYRQPITILYKNKDELFGNKRIWETIDEITFKIKNEIYQYEEITNDKFMFDYKNKYEDLIFINLNYNTYFYCINNNMYYLNNPGYLIYETKKYQLKPLYFNNQVLFLIKYSELPKINDNECKYKLKNNTKLYLSNNNDDHIKILSDHFITRTTWKYKYFYSIELIELDIDYKISKGLEMLCKKIFNNVNNINYNIMTYKECGFEERKER